MGNESCRALHRGRLDLQFLPPPSTASTEALNLRENSPKPQAMQETWLHFQTWRGDVAGCSLSCTCQHVT